MSFLQVFSLTVLLCLVLEKSEQVGAGVSTNNNPGKGMHSILLQ